MNFFDELAGISGERRFPTGDWFSLVTMFGWFAGHIVQMSIRRGQRHLSVRFAVRAGRVGTACVHCKGCPASVVRRSMIPLHRDPAPLRGGRGMTVHAVVRSGLPVGFVLIFLVCHGVCSRGKRIPFPRPQNDAVRRNVGEFADSIEILHLGRTIRTEKSASESSFHGLGSIRSQRQFGVHAGLFQHGAPEFQLRRDDRFMRPDRLRHASVASVVHGSACVFRAKIVFQRGESLCQTISFAVKPAPPVEETNLMRRNLACTLATARASPVVAVVASMVWYSASMSAIAPCKTILTAVGAVPKIVCQRTAGPVSGCPAQLGIANWLPACAPPGNA